jgi:EAL domain-containing protein (putative c-di-GMP-specific phosphodiesterase class I)
LRRAGVRVAIDDFGTGYSSLVYLRELTFDVLKIDRAFVMGLPEQKSMAIVQAVLAVAHALGKTVVAEGVESELHERVLKDLGCDFAQGYLFSVPLGSEEFVAWAVRRATGSRASTALINAR